MVKIIHSHASLLMLEGLMMIQVVKDATMNNYSFEDIYIYI